ncbi:Adenylate and Guanylate cyclase catalytic domain [Carpediemonas membranifera]|uniref:adenylate cyclase n=1 Tax=Carpediemonas membranifera TaxID=201153 RepID=A0A8J6AVZ4_9EUKA|nr:Adenylate and Guanylate cyclase catalytic domain [Carpediemonas membranifera]|eukprot:KAG9396181.1 Adenylate and Guanylate cyclase catalytic domain [Carpediemonas membranifera]
MTVSSLIREKSSQTFKLCAHGIATIRCTERCAHRFICNRNRRVFWHQLALTIISIVFGCISILMMAFVVKPTITHIALSLTKCVCLLLIIPIDVFFYRHRLRLVAFYICISLFGFFSAIRTVFVLHTDSGNHWDISTFMHTALFVFVAFQAWLIPIHHLAVAGLSYIGIQLLPVVIACIFRDASSSMMIGLVYHILVLYLSVWLGTRLNVAIRTGCEYTKMLATLTEQLQRQHSTMASHLKALIPSRILRRLDGAESSVVECYSEAIIIFVSIVFDRERMDIEEYVKTLNQCVAAIEDFSESFGVERIKTVESKVMLFCDTAKIVEIYTFLHALTDMFRTIYAPLTLKAGVSVGPVSGGVIGRLRFQYDVWGTVVNAAARMEALARPNTAVLTEAAYATARGPLPGNIATQLEPIDVKGLGVLRPWVLSLSKFPAIQEEIHHSTLSVTAPTRHPSVGSTASMFDSLSERSLGILAGESQSFIQEEDDKFALNWRLTFADRSIRAKYYQHTSAATPKVYAAVFLLGLFMWFIVHAFEACFYSSGSADAFILILVVMPGVVVLALYTVALVALVLVLGTRHSTTAAGILYTIFYVTVLYQYLLVLKIHGTVSDSQEMVHSMIAQSSMTLVLFTGLVRIFDFTSGLTTLIVSISGYIILQISCGATVGWASLSPETAVVDLALFPVVVAMTFKNRLLRSVLLFQLTEKAQAVEHDVRAMAGGKRRLLDLIYPKSISDTVISGKPYVPQLFPSVAVLFFDIVDFTRTAGMQTCSETAAMLNWLYRMCDKEVASMAGLRVNKICTIGDAYIAACGAPEPSSSPVVPLIRLAHAIIDFLESPENGEFAGLRCRFGLAFGEAVGAVMGRDCRSIFDLFGPAVREAELMETTGLPNRVHISGPALKVWKGTDPKSMVDFAFFKRSPNLEGHEGKHRGFIVKPRGGIAVDNHKN